MTTEPKFVPNNAATIEFDDGFTVNVRLVDCVGYVIPEAKGYKDEDGIRMVRTPGMMNRYHSMRLPRPVHRRLFRIIPQSALL